MSALTQIDAVDIAARLIRCPSIVPDDAGAQDILAEALAALGFSVERMTLGPEGAEVQNLYARYGSEGPHLAFAGHTDVVPTGETDDWSFDPFGGEVIDGKLRGRGAADMKGALGAFVAAAAELISSGALDRGGSLSFLITGDEEGPAHFGTQAMMADLAEAGEAFDFCIVGEPSSNELLGDTIKNGRRGSLNGEIRLPGIQGHVAYPDKADNPVRRLADVLSALPQGLMDGGTTHFDPSNLEVTNVHAGTHAYNVIPGSAKLGFNIRFNTAHDSSQLMDHIRALLTATGHPFELDFDLKGEAFLTRKGPLIEALVEAVSGVTGLVPVLSTTGGTSDARFIKDYCPVAELGLKNATIHAVDERTPVADIHQLTDIYVAAALRLLGG